MCGTWTKEYIGRMNKMSNEYNELINLIELNDLYNFKKTLNKYSLNYYNYGIDWYQSLKSFVEYKFNLNEKHIHNVKFHKFKDTIEFSHIHNRKNSVIHIENDKILIHDMNIKVCFFELSQYLNLLDHMLLDLKHTCINLYEKGLTEIIVQIGHFQTLKFDNHDKPERIIFVYKYMKDWLQKYKQDFMQTIKGKTLYSNRNSLMLAKHIYGDDVFELAHIIHRGPVPLS